MAHELRHVCVGCELTKAEYVSVTGHSFACQATGDIVYASSSSQLRRLAKGADNTILTLSSCVPAWTASPTLTDLTVSGGCITLTGAATDIDLIDNNASALSFDASGQTGLIVIDTRNCAEGVTMSGTLGVTGNTTVSADLTVSGGCITLTGAATDVDLIDDNASALSFDASGKTGIIDIVTTNCSEGVTMSGTLGVTGVVTATGGIELSHACQNTLTGSGGVLSIQGNRIFHAGGTDIPVADGGTGASTLTANGILVGNGTSAIQATATMATKGHVMIGDGSGVPTMLAVGSNCEVLTACSGETTGVKWAAAGGGAVSAVANGSDNRIATFSSSTALNGEANLTFDGTNLTVGTGNVIVGTAGKGVDFSASTHSTLTGASMENELLDDYEEGTWTPYYAEANTNANTTGQSVAHGRYTKIGRLVIATFRCIVNSLDNISTSTDGCVLMGLPFTAASGTAGYGGGMSAFHGEGLNIGTDESVSGYTENGAALVTLKVWAGGVGSAGGGGAFTIDHLTVDGGFIGTVTYFSAT